MTPAEFIRKNLHIELGKMGVSAESQETLSDEGVRYWRESAQFKKGAWAETLTYVKRRASKMQKAKQ